MLVLTSSRSRACPRQCPLALKVEVHRTNRDAGAAAQDHRTSTLMQKVRRQIWCERGSKWLITRAIAVNTATCGTPLRPKQIGSMQIGAMDPMQPVSKEETAFDPSSIIAHIRTFLQEGGEEAGCTIWDLSASRPTAELLVTTGRLIDVVEVLLSADKAKDGEPNWRLMELCIGICANLCSHEGLCSELVQGSLPSMLLSSIQTISNPPCVTELCRLVSVALRQEVCTPLASLRAGARHPMHTSCLP